MVYMNDYHNHQKYRITMQWIIPKIYQQTHFYLNLRADYGPTFIQRKGVTDPLRPCGPSLRPTQGPDVRLPEIVTFRWGDWAARPVIGPLTKTRRRTITVHDCVKASVWSLRCVNAGPKSTLKECRKTLTLPFFFKKYKTNLLTIW